MIRGSLIKGKPIVADRVENPLGKISEVIIDDVNNRVTAFEVANGSPDKMLVLPWSGVQIARANEVVATSHTMIVEAKQVFEVKQVLERSQFQIEKAVVSSLHEEIGIMTDFYFDELTGQIKGLEVSGDFYGDSEFERIFVPMSYVVKMATDAVYLSPDFQNLIQTDISGFKHAVQALNDHVATINTVKYNTIVDPDSEENDPLSVQAKLIRQWHLLVAVLYNALVNTKAFTLSEPEFQALIAKYTIDKTINMRVEQDVESADGSLVAAAGQLVSPEIINLAKEKNVVFNLMKAVGLNIEHAEELALNNSKVTM